MRSDQLKICNIRLASAFALLTCFCALLFALWVYSLPGTRGLFEWMPYYKILFLCILTTACLPLILLITTHIFHINKQIIFLVTIVWNILIITTLSVIAFQMYRRPSSVPNITKIDNPPGKPLTHVAFSSDIHFGSSTNNIAATRNILKTIRTGNFDAFFILGDIAEIGFPGSDLFDASQCIVSEIPDIPLSTLLGNHGNDERNIPDS